MHVEKFVADPEKRRSQGLKPDLKVTGKASFQQICSDYDLTIHSIFSKGVVERLSASGNRLACARAAIGVALEKKEEKKNRKYLGKTNSAFHPIVISSGGTLSPSTLELFKFWQKTLHKTVYREFMTDLSVGLLRARAFCFKL